MPSEDLDSCSTLVKRSTKVRVSLGDNSPSSPHLRLDRSGGHMQQDDSDASKINDLKPKSCQCSPKSHGRKNELCAVMLQNASQWLQAKQFKVNH